MVTRPWYEIAVDLVGPWEIKVKNRLISFNALTVIDTATNLVEITRVDNKSCKHVTLKLRQCWLSRYPRPHRIVHDGGGKFTGRVLRSYAALLVTSKTPNLQQKILNPTQYAKGCI